MAGVGTPKTPPMGWATYPLWYGTVLCVQYEEPWSVYGGVRGVNTTCH
ncbi:hypothetical protein OOU_Y34scaffold00666g204 [Pyricularia oryzae Y34]|uniref:Uncharacterized protein n=3 Tax=Pyricularia oryzae TaxID=318829 RepID=A0A4V1C8A3_PYROR|nr:hypothetical protein OOU_Y34scaffold00666g204 [Pyricularia oryzae Y34]QBZ66188.1 hypothetical protein PoMZ_13160 [Pyricularia oryzae]